jgi:hypothetical protein
MHNESQVGLGCYEAFWALANWVWSINGEIGIPFVSNFCPTPAGGQVVRQMVRRANANSVVHHSAGLLDCPGVTPLKTGMPCVGFWSFCLHFYAMIVGPETRLNGVEAVPNRAWIAQVQTVLKKSV